MHLRKYSRRAMLRSLVSACTVAATPRKVIAALPSDAAIQADPLRPRYHLMPKRGWMNDPCAPVYFRGRYHMFFQYNPYRSVWGDMHWAHAVSTDMVHWSERPVALAPTPGGPDAYGVFTGSMVLDHGTPTVLYTCVAPSSRERATLWGSNPPEREQQCLAAPVGGQTKGPDAALDVWHKLPQPVLTTPPAGMNVTGFRDPVPWQEADGSYYMLLASGQKGVGGNVLLYKSDNLRSWTFQHIFAEGKWTGRQADDTVDSGEMWECPDFFPLGEKHILIHSTGTETGRKTMWQSGRLDRATMQWTPEKEGLLNYGPYYAPKTQLDAAGNRILWGWIEETRPKQEFAKAGWAGCMSLPRVLTLQNGEVRFVPAQQISSLRGAANPAKTAMAVEVLLQLTRDTRAQATDFLRHGLRVSSGNNASFRWQGADVGVRADLPEQLALRCFLDHSVVEVFVGDRMVLTARVYNGQPAHLELPAGFTANEIRAFAMQSTS